MSMETTTFASQAEIYLTEIATRRVRPAKANTLHVYRSMLNARILPSIGREDLANVGNKTAKLLVGRLAEAGLSPASINLAVTLVKQIVASAVDEDGNELYPRTWKADFIQTPEVNPASQKAPTVPASRITEALGATYGPVKALIALLGGSGLRIGEALGIGLGNVWDPQAGTVTITGTLVEGEFQPSPKTEAGNRVVDLPGPVNVLLKAVYPTEDARKGTLFPASDETYRRKLAELGIPGFHSLRRFRITHLQAASVPAPVIKFWAGHAAGDITERYTKVGAMIEERKQFSKSAGLGFQL